MGLQYFVADGSSPCCGGAFSCAGRIRGMEPNPYESPKEAHLPPDNRRGWRWLGTLLIVLAIVPYVPMTATPFIALAGFLEQPAYMTSRGLFAAGVFNGCVCA